MRLPQIWIICIFSSNSTSIVTILLKLFFIHYKEKDYFWQFKSRNWNLEKLWCYKKYRWVGIVVTVEDVIKKVHEKWRKLQNIQKTFFFGTVVDLQSGWTQDIGVGCSKWVITFLNGEVRGESLGSNLNYICNVISENKGYSGQKTNCSKQNSSKLPSSHDI